MMKRRILVFLLLVLFCISGCARTATIKRLKASKVIQDKIIKPKHYFIVGEKLTFLGAWKGIPIGKATATVEEITKFKDYEVYKIVVVAKTNDFLSKFFKVEDTFTSYVDTTTLTSRHYESIIKEGNYRKNLVIDYDFEKNIALSTNLRDGSVKTCLVEKNVHDPISAAYFVRTMPMKIGDVIEITVHQSEENYVVGGKIEKKSVVTLPTLGAFTAFLIRPYLKLKGKKLGWAKIWGYTSDDENRFILYLHINVLKIPWVGEVTGTLEKIEYISPATDIQKIDHNQNQQNRS